MAWGDCGVNQTTGEPMGYNHEGVCHFPGCDKEIDHGLSYVCGGMHEGGELGCGYYFCDDHHNNVVRENAGMYVLLCDKCYTELEASEEADKVRRQIQ